VPGGEYSVANVDNRNVAAQAGGAAARAVGDNQKMGNGGSTERKKDLDPTAIERIVAEERESKGKLPKYPGLERWILVDKMGDGAFSNVYRAKDSTGQMGEVAIKVVRKFEMNSNQVSMHRFPQGLSFYVFAIGPVFVPPNPTPVLYQDLSVLSVIFGQQWVVTRATIIFTQTSRSNQRLWRCA